MPAVHDFLRRIGRSGPRFIAAPLCAVALALVLLVPPPCAGAEEGGAKRNTPVLEPAPEPGKKHREPGKSDEKPAEQSREPGKGEGAPSGNVQAATQPAPVRLFGTVEFRSPIAQLPKWQRVRDSEIKRPSFTATGLDTNNTSVAQRWNWIREKVSDAPLMEKVKEVNKFFNQWPYKMDREIWGVEDYWATPREFVQKSGDCEDYAITKYYALRDLGVPANLLRVAAVKDNIRNIGHAVLIVYMDDDARVLDNLTNLVLSHKKLPHYLPQYTVNEEFLWRHVMPKAAPVKK